MPAANAPAQGFMGPTGLPVIHFWKQWFLPTGVILDAVNKINSIEFNEAIPDWNARGTTAPKEMILITQSLKELQLLMTDYVGIVRTNVRLERAMKRLDLLHEETEELYQTTSCFPATL